MQKQVFYRSLLKCCLNIIGLAVTFYKVSKSTTLRGLIFSKLFYTVDLKSNSAIARRSNWLINEQIFQVQSMVKCSNGIIDFLFK